MNSAEGSGGSLASGRSSRDQSLRFLKSLSKSELAGLEILNLATAADLLNLQTAAEADGQFAQPSEPEQG